MNEMTTASLFFFGVGALALFTCGLIYTLERIAKALERIAECLEEKRDKRMAGERGE